LQINIITETFAATVNRGT